LIQSKTEKLNNKALNNNNNNHNNNSNNNNNNTGSDTVRRSEGGFKNAPKQTPYKIYS
jgi:hypothetical protein